MTRRAISLPALLASGVLVLAACAETATEPPGSDAASGARSNVVATSIQVVMSNLDAPRQMAWGPEGGLYVVEAGNREINGPCAAVYRGNNCYSGTGAVTRLWKGKQERVAEGLPSVYNPDVNEISGPQDISFQGRGNARITIGWGSDPAHRAQLGELAAGFGSLLQLRPNGSWRTMADVSALERELNPAGGPFDSNPYGALAEGDVTYVTDAGGNSLIEVAANGATSVVAVFSPIPVPPGPFNPPFAASEPVPTEVVRGPDGALYASLLTGVPFLPGAASIMRVVPGQAPVVHEGGFAMITDFDWAADGSLYLVQYASAPFFGGPGLLIRIAPDGSRTVLTDQLLQATGVLAAPDGSVYVSHHGNQPGTGEVLRVVP